MPKYTWKCPNCGETAEVDRKISDCYVPPTESCNCPSPEWEKAIDISVNRWRFHD
jgi:putative FmdB family regulatory protein